MRLLITGGAGCLGSNLIEHFLPQGHEILVLDNFATGKRQLVPKLPRLGLVEGSVANETLVDETFAAFRPTHVIHSAAAYKNPLDHREDVATNILGSINVARASASAGVRRIVNFQTALCYGRPQQVPIPVDHSTSPFTSYGISKNAGEQFLFLSDLPVVSLRLANICGPRLAIGPIPTFYKRLKSGQNCFCSDSERDFLDMSDFFALMDRVLVDDAPTGVFNVSTGVGHTIHQVFCAVAAHLGMPVPEVKIVPVGSDDVKRVVLDPSLTERTFGWRAVVGFDTLIQSQLKWYDQHGVTDIYSHLSAVEGT